MRLSRLRFTLLQLMTAVAVIACFLVLLASPYGVPIVCGLCSLVLAVTFHGFLRGQRQRAARAFGIASVVLNCSFAALSIYALNMIGIVLMFFELFCGVPLVLGFGTAWAAAATRRDSISRRSPIVAWPLVAVLAALPLTMLFTQWPLRLAFVVSRPALDRLADRVATGMAPPGIVRAGFFIVVDSAVDPTTGNVGLITDPNPSGRSGFVRISRAAGTSSGGTSGPFHNLNGDLPLGGGWRYQSED